MKNIRHNLTSLRQSLLNNLGRSYQHLTNDVISGKTQSLLSERSSEVWRFRGVFLRRLKQI